MSVMREQEVVMVRMAGRDLALLLIDESPCRRACPAGINVKRYVGQIAAGDFVGALATIRRHMPFPSACGRVCLHPCENECARGEIDEPIAIMHLKRFASDYEIRRGRPAPLPERGEPTGKKIAVVGSGPAGLTAGHDLVLKGHDVVVFERRSEPGGMMTQAIPESELPSDAVRRDIERIERIGVQIKCGCSIEGAEGLDELLERGFDAVLLATGCAGRWRGFSGPSWIPGGDAEGVIGAVEFMKQHRAGGSSDAARELGRTVILGWGVHALGCARTAIRIGCSEVSWIIPLEKGQLQPDARLIKQAEEEGVRIIELRRAKGIDISGGRVTGVRCVQVRLGKPDHVGRRDLTEQPDTDEIIPCDTVIDAAYFAPDGSWGSLSGGPWKNIQVNLDTMATSRPGVFAAGDVVSGPKSVVEAVALGHRAAAGIERYLAGDEKPVGTLSTPIRTRSWAINDPARTPSDAYRPSVRPPDARKNDFQESELPFTAWQATHEARRCLMCGPCEECAVCIPSCDRKRGAARGESGERLMVRVPLAVARSVAEEGEPAATEGMALYIARVDPERCRGCGVCEEICEYCAPRVAPDSHDRFTAAIDILACKGCGTCVAACPSGAIDQGVTSLHAMREMIIGGVR